MQSKVNISVQGRTKLNNMEKTRFSLENFRKSFFEDYSITLEDEQIYEYLIKNYDKYKDEFEAKKREIEEERIAWIKAAEDRTNAELGELRSKKEEMQTKLEEVCKVEKAQVLKILLESRKQLDILIDGVTLSPSADSD